MTTATAAADAGAHLWSRTDSKPADVDVAVSAGAGPLASCLLLRTGD